MQDSWLTHNTDKLLLFILFVLVLGMIIFFFHHGGDEKLMDWAEGVGGTILGALIMVLTGRLNRADGQTGNGLPPNSATVGGK